MNLDYDSVIGWLVSQYRTTQLDNEYLACGKGNVSQSLRKTSKYEVISGPYFSVFGLNTAQFSILNPNTGKHGPEIGPYLDTFFAVSLLRTFLHIIESIFRKLVLEIGGFFTISNLV